MDQQPEPPRRIKRFVPKLRNNKLFRTMFLRNSAPQENDDRPNPDLNVDGGISSDPSGLTASSMMPERPTDLVGGQMYAPQGQPSTSGRPLAAPPPPPRHVAIQMDHLQQPSPQPRHVVIQMDQQQQSPPQPQPRPPAVPQPIYPQLAHLAPSTSAWQHPLAMPQPPQRGDALQRHRPPPLQMIMDRGYEAAAADAAVASRPLTPPQERPSAEAAPTTTTQAQDPINPATGRPYWKTKPFAAKRHPCVTSAENSPMDTTPPVETPPTSPMDTTSPPNTPTDSPPQQQQQQQPPAPEEIAKRVNQAFD